MVVRWVVREQGVTLAGPKPSTLVDPIPVTALRRETMHTLRCAQRAAANPAPFGRQLGTGMIEVVVALDVSG